MDFQAETFGRFRFLEVLGQGHFGTVYRAYDDHLNREVAVKVYAGRSPSFRNEVEVLSRMEHPNLVKLLDVLTDEKSGQHYLVQDLVVGSHAQEFLKGASWTDRWEAIAQILRGLEYLHQRGTVHHDIKPSNMLVAPGNGGHGPKVKILDFGVAERIGKRGADGTFSGTFPYVAPEVLRGEIVDGRADLYSLGMVLYESIANPDRGSSSRGASNGVKRENGESPPPTLRTGEVPREGRSPVRPLRSGDDPLRPAPGTASGMTDQDPRREQNRYAIPASPADLKKRIEQTLSRRAPESRDLPPDLPYAFGELLFKLLQSDPHRRFRSANHAIRFINRALGTRFDLEPGRLRLPDRLNALLVGRQRELSEIQNCFEAFSHGHAPVFSVAILGAREHGKSALLHGLLQWARAHDLPVLPVLAPDAGLSHLFAPLVRGTDSPELDRFASYLKPILPDRFGSAPAPELLEGDPALERKRLTEKLAEALAVALGDRRFILLADDLPDKPGLAEFLAYYVRHYASTVPDRELFLVFAASDAGELPPDLRVDRRIELRPWSPEELKTVVPSLLWTDSVPDHFTRAVWEETEGRPGRVVEYLRLIADRLLRAGEDLEAQLKTLTESDLKQVGPAQDLVREGFSKLEDEERRILQWLAVAPRELSAEEMSELDPTLRLGAPAALRRLRDEGWVSPLRNGFRLASVSRKAFVSGLISPETGKGMHLRFGDVMRVAGEGNPLDRAGELIRGGETERGFLAARPELETMLRLSQPTGVIEFLESHAEATNSLSRPLREDVRRLQGEAYVAAGHFPKAIAALEGTDHFLLLARAYRYGGKLTEARVAAEQARQSARDARSKISADILLADLCMEQGQYREAEETVEPYLSEPGRCDAEEQAAFRHIKAKAHFYKGEYDRAIPLFRQNCAETERPGGRLSRRGLALNSLATAYLAQGKLDDGLPLLHSCSEISRQIGDLRTLGLAHVNLGLAYSEKGEPDRAVKDYETALATFRKIGDRTNEARTLYNMGVLDVQLGDFTQAEERFADVLELARSLKMTHLEVTALLQRAELHRQRDALGPSLADLNQAEDLATRLGLPQEKLFARLKKLEIRLGSDEADRILADLHPCEQEMEGPGYSEHQTWALYLRGRLCENSRPAEAGKLYEKALKKWTEAGTADPALKGKIEDGLRGLRRGSPPLPSSPPKGIEGEGRSLSPSLPQGENQREEDILSILGLVEKMNEAIDPSDVLSAIMDALMNFTGAERGFLLLREGDRLHARVSRASASTGFQPGDDLFSMTVADETLRKNEPVVTFDAASDPRFQDSESVHHLRLRSIVCVPMRVHGESFGALYFDSRARTGQFGERHLPVLRALSHLAALAIHKAKLNANLHSLVARREKDLEAAHHRLELILDEEKPKYRYDHLIGTSRVWRRVLRMVDRAVESRVPILLLGESGTGKELVARAIHFNSARKNKAFVPVNCAAIPADLFESELFGHVRGAFTGADRDKPGLIETAQGGTLFLDEIGDLPVGVQPKFLRVLQDGVVRRVGDREEIRVDFRLIAATHRDLQALLKTGLFREDLFYRLSVFEISLPPLRERPEDIPELAKHFLMEFAREEGKPPKKIAAANLARLRAYDWPGNIRELENVVRRAYLFSTGKEVEIPLPRRRLPPSIPTESEPPVTLRQALDAVRKQHLEAALRRTGGNVSAAARELRVDRTHLATWIKKFRLV